MIWETDSYEFIQSVLKNKQTNKPKEKQKQKKKILGPC